MAADVHHLEDHFRLLLTETCLFVIDSVDDFYFEVFGIVIVCYIACDYGVESDLCRCVWWQRGR